MAHCHGFCQQHMQTCEVQCMEEWIPNQEFCIIPRTRTSAEETTRVSLMRKHTNSLIKLQGDDYTGAPLSDALPPACMKVSL